MAGNKAPPPIAIIGCAAHRQLLPQLHWPTGPIDVWLALLEKVWPEPSSGDFGSLAEGLYRDKGTEAVQHKMQKGCSRIGDVPILQSVHPELVHAQGDEQGYKGDKDCYYCWHCVAKALVADGGIIQEVGAISGPAPPVKRCQGYYDEQGEEECAIVLSSEHKAPVYVTDPPAASSC